MLPALVWPLPYVKKIRLRLGPLQDEIPLSDLENRAPDHISQPRVTRSDSQNAPHVAASPAPRSNLLCLAVSTFVPLVSFCKISICGTPLGRVYHSVTSSFCRFLCSSILESKQTLCVSCVLCGLFILSGLVPSAEPPFSLFPPVIPAFRLSGYCNSTPWPCCPPAALHPAPLRWHTRPTNSTDPTISS